jgi:hypothetical protein
MTLSTLDCSPVLALEHNITAGFESFQRNASEIVAQGLLDGEILLEVDAALPRTPSVSRAAGAAAQIRVHVALLELLWAFVYSWMVRYEETVQKAQMCGDDIGSTTPYNNGLVTRAESLWVWARNLRSGYTMWPKDLPSPVAQANDLETYYAEKANFVFERATAFILLHECAHATQGHLDVPQLRGGADASNVQLENEADQRAFDTLVGQGLADEEKSAVSWAILSSMLSTLFTLPNFQSALVSRTHPPLHHRLGHLLNSLDFHEERYRYYFHLLCRVVLQDAFPALARPGQKLEDAAESLQAALDDLDDLAASKTT